MIKLISEAVTDVKKGADEKLVKVPLLERKMNKWIKIFEQSEKDNNHRGTDTAKKIHDVQDEIHKLQKTQQKFHKTLARLDMNMTMSEMSSKASSQSPKRKKRRGTKRSPDGGI